MKSGSVPELRSDLERIDRQLVELVAERVRLARRIGRAKREDGRGPLDTGREATVIRRAAELGRDAGLEPEDVRELFWTIIGICRRAQLEEK